MKNYRVGIYRLYSDIQKSYRYFGIYYINCTSFKHCNLNIIYNKNNIYKYFEEKSKNEIDVLQIEIPIFTGGKKFFLKESILNKKFGTSLVRVGNFKYWNEIDTYINGEYLYTIDIPEDKLLESLEINIPDDVLNDNIKRPRDEYITKYMRYLWIKEYGITQVFLED